jgi:CheY-like chemotaxis protein
MGDRLDQERAERDASLAPDGVSRLRQSQFSESRMNVDATAVTSKLTPSHKDPGWLVVTRSSTPGTLGRIFKLEGRDAVLGRGPEAEVQLVDDGISRRHARIVRAADGAFELQDLDSTNGTFHNGLRLKGGIRLDEGDKVELGGLCQLRFSLSQPLDPDDDLREVTAGVSPAVSVGAESGRPGVRVLVVDDEPFICSAIQRLLRRDHAVTTATSAREALGLVSAGQWFDVILSDLMMPEMSGEELLSTLREVAPEQARRVVMMTGGAFTPRSEEFLSSLDRPHLTKPLTLEGLHAAIQKALETPSAAA